MPVVTFVHDAADPLASGELRRLGLAALAVEGQGWTARFVAARDRRALERAIRFADPNEHSDLLAQARRS